MGDQFISQPSFIAGEVAPDVYGRIDQELYYTGLRTGRNFIIRQYGGASNRMGSLFTSETQDSTHKTRLIPFQFNEVQAYSLEFGNFTMRVIKNGGEVLESATATAITGITQANPAVVTSAGHGKSNGQDVFITGVVGMVEVNNRAFRVANVAANTFELHDYSGTNINSTGYAAYTSGGTNTRIYTVVTPYAEADLFNLNYTQSNDVLTVCNSSYQMRDITRTAHDNWTVNPFANTDGPFKDKNATTTTVYAQGVTQPVAGAANAGGLIRVQVTSTAAMTTGMKVIIAGVGGVPNANGNFTITVIDGTHIDLQGSVFGGAYTAGGTVQQSGDVGITINLISSVGIFAATDVGTLFFLQQPLIDTTPTWEVAKTVKLGDVRRAGFNYYQALTAGTTGTVKPDWTIGALSDGDPGVRWQYLHSNFGIVNITAFVSATQVTATVQSRLPDNVMGATGASTIWAKAAWSSTEGYPAAAAYCQQRLVTGGTLNQPNTLWISGVSARTFFGMSNPILADEAITLALDATQVNSVRHILPVSSLAVMTAATEQIVAGTNDKFDATDLPVAKTQGSTGSSKVMPIITGDGTVLYVQDMGGEVHTFRYDWQTNLFTGINMSARSPHLFLNRQIVDWCFQKQPLSVVWAVMSDGALLAFTFMNEQKVYAWTRCDTDGFYESVCAIREGNETAVYMVVRRTINGVQKRYVERFSTRWFATIRDCHFVDCGLTYDGRNTGATTMTVTGGTTWDAPEILTVTASAPTFVPADVGNQVIFWDNSGTVPVARRLTISAYTSNTVVSAVPTKLITAPYRGVARTDWEFAKLHFVGFNHLEAKNLSILADGVWVTEKSTITVTNGKFTLPQPAAVVKAGLQFISDLETLDMAAPQGQTKAKTLNVPRVFVTVKETRNIWAATNAFDSDDGTLSKFLQYKERDPAIGYDSAIPFSTGMVEIQLNSIWSNKGRLCIRQTGPFPITITCITPEVVVGTS